MISFIVLLLCPGKFAFLVQPASQLASLWSPFHLPHGPLLHDRLYPSPHWILPCLTSIVSGQIFSLRERKEFKVQEEDMRHSMLKELGMKFKMSSALVVWKFSVGMAVTIFEVILVVFNFWIWVILRGNGYDAVKSRRRPFTWFNSWIYICGEGERDHG